MFGWVGFDLRFGVMGYGDGGFLRFAFWFAGLGLVSVLCNFVIWTTRTVGGLRF